MIWLPLPTASPLNSLYTMSPRSSVQMQRPCMPARLSEKPIACALKPTAGRCAPVSNSDPVSSKTAARCAAPRCSVRRVPAAVQVPSNACHASRGGVCVAGSPDWPHAAVARRAASTSNRRLRSNNAFCREITSLPLKNTSRAMLRNNNEYCREITSLPLEQGHRLQLLDFHRRLRTKFLPVRRSCDGPPRRSS